MMRIPPLRASTSTCLSSSAPCGPISLKPAEMTMAPFTPAAAQSRMTPGIAGAGVMITARSTSAGTALTLGYALIPSTLGRLRFTGKTVPPKGVLMRFHRIVRPTLPGVSVAPITATFSGEKNTSSGWGLFKIVVSVS